MKPDQILLEELAGLGDCGYTPLMNAVIARDQAQVEELLLDGANVNAVGRKSRTALLLAICKDNADLVSLLLDFGADTEATDMRGITALIRASRTGDLSVVRVLLERGACSNAVSHWGSTALDYAILDNHLDIAKLLLEWGARPDIEDRGTVRSVLRTAIAGYDPYGRRLRFIPLLLEHGADVHHRSRTGQTVLELLLLRYADILQQAPDKHVKKSTECMEQWAERERLFAEAVVRLEEASARH